VTDRTPEPDREPVAGAAQAGGREIFCEDDIDALLATIDLGEINESEARRAAEEACLAFEILARAMNRAAGAAEEGIMRGLEAPLRKGVESGIERLPAPLRRPGRETLDRRG
jgi:hypothetical protein